MKNLKFLLVLAIFVIASNVGFALPPYFYTNIAINQSGQLIPSTAVNVEISIFQNNTLIYKELHNGISTSAFSFFSVEVGTGLPQAPFSIGDFTALTATVTAKTQARIDIGGGTWVSLGAAYNTNIINKGFTGNPAEIDLPSGMLLVGDPLNNASAVSIYNDATIDNTGALTISNNAITTSKIADGNVTYSKIHSASAPNKLLVSGGTNDWIETSASTAGLNLLNIANGNANQYLISNGNGTVQWSNPLSSGWGLTGNAGTVAGTNFIGTTDNSDFDVRTNNSIKWRFKKNGVLEFLDGANLYIGERAGTIDTLTSLAVNNTAIGALSLSSITTGNFNTAVGFYSLQMNNSQYNTGIGFQALQNTTTSYNTALGALALRFNSSGSANTAVGYYSLTLNTTGINNTAIGYLSLSDNTIGYENTAVGFQSIYNNSTGHNNTGVGVNSLFSNNAGYQNTAIGFSALVTNTTGYNNSAFGVQSLQNNNIGYYNTAGGVSALELNTSGNYNTAFGTSALHANTTGSDNTGIGNNAGPNATNYNNTTAIGANSTTTASNQVRIGDASVTSIGGFAGWTNLSDGRFKMNVNENIPGLEFVMKLRPVSYNVDLNKLNAYLGIQKSAKSGNEISQAETMIHTGFIAQEVESAANTLGFDFSGVDHPKNENDYYGLRYGDFVVPLTKAIQEQQALIEAQQKLIEQLQQQNAMFTSQIEELQYQMKLVKMQFKSAKK